MNFAEQAFSELFPDKIAPPIKVTYSNKFSSYNANVKKTAFSIEFKLSKSWKDISEPIQIGLLQGLLLKLYKTKKTTINIELYHNFTKHIHISVPKNKTDPELDACFNRVNEKYFGGMIEKTNLRWGGMSTTTMGTYNYNSDTITISSILKNAPSVFVDYVMYHEILHKKLKFYSVAGRNYHHTSEFRKSERQFENQLVVEKELKDFLRAQKRISKPRKKWWQFV
jgi:hypothetical protein